MNVKTILVDGRVLSMNYCGIGSFCYNALMEFSKRSDIKLIICSNLPINECYSDILNLSNVSIIISPLPFFKNRGIFWFIFKLPFLIRKYKIDYFWTPSVLLPLFIPNKIKTLITIHDVVLQEYSETMSFRNKIINILFTDKSVNKANLIWCVSNYTKNKIRKYYPKKSEDMFFVGSSINHNFYKTIDFTIKEKELYLKRYDFSGNEHYLLFVGTLEPRKNLKFLLSLMPILSKRNCKLIVVGGKGWGKTDIAKVINAKGFPKESVYFTGYVDNNELRFLYNIVDCFVSTSLNEGFGLPQLEAISCNCPVVCANNSAMSEVVGGAGVLVDGWEVNNWCYKIMWAINHKEQITCNYPHKLSQYNWTNIINDLNIKLDNNIKIFKQELISR